MRGTESKVREGELTLIPGLLEDAAMECLARVPSRWHGPMRRVCRGWRRAVGSPEFLRRRRIAGSAEDIVFLVQADGSSNTSATPQCWLATANLTTGEWRRAEVQGALPLFAQCAVAGRHVAVLGGWDPATLRPARDVRVLDAPGGGKWRRGQPMPDARSFFGCAGGGGGCGSGDAIHVAGGHDGSRRPLRSAWAYSVAADAWHALPDMREARDEPQLVVASWPSSGSGGAGRLFAASGYPTVAQGACKKTAECYAAGDDEAWSDEGSMVPEAVLVSVGRGKLWAVGAGKGGVREYWDGAWREVADGPPGMKACVKAVGIGGGGLLVFGKVQRRGDNAAGELGKYAAWVMRTDTVGARRWNRVPVPPGFRAFVYSAAAVRV